jgi:hypothetical protein
MLKNIYDVTANLLVNDRLYLFYFWFLIGGAVLLAVLRILGFVTDQMDLAPGLTAVVTRGPESIGIIGGTFATIVAVLNLGVAQLIFPLLSSQVNRFAFLIVMLETAAWAYLVYRWPPLTNWLVGLRLSG